MPTYRGRDGISRSEANETYAPLVTSFRLYPTQFVAVTGTPVVSSVNLRIPCIAFDATADERCVAGFTVPPGWATFDVDFIVANLTADAGDIRWSCDFIEYADGDNLNVTPTQQASVVTAAAQYIEDIAQVSTSSFACTPGKQQLLRVGRTGNSGTDTKAGDMGLVAVIIRKAS